MLHSFKNLSVQCKQNATMYMQWSIFLQPHHIRHQLILLLTPLFQLINDNVKEHCIFITKKHNAVSSDRLYESSIL